MNNIERLPMTLVVRRGAAYLLDGALLAALVVASQFALRAVLGANLPPLETGWQIERWVLLTVSVPAWAYFSLFESSRWQATPAKRLLGLRVTTLGGERASWGRTLLRTALKLLPWELTHVTLMLPTPIWGAASAELRPGLWVVYGLLAVYVLCAALTPRRQAPHDLIAGTLVVPA
jgi:uncharacterized RDD family membrane protein YckC